MPVAHQVGDTEYIAIQSGWGIDACAFRMAETSIKLDPNAVPQCGVVWVFALRRQP
jgi:hypothetical protein